MSIEQNKALVGRLFEALNTGLQATIAARPQIFAPTEVAHFAGHGRPHLTEVHSMRIVRLLRVAVLAAIIVGLAALAAPATAPIITPYAEVRSNHVGVEPLHGAELAGFKTRAGGTEVSI